MADLTLAGFVACCHGERRDEHFESSLALGPRSLRVSDVVGTGVRAALALLPACHAGETREDAAGNGMGIAAAFLLGGAKVVAASSKAVPDVLAPWLSTLTVWHVLEGLSLHEAAVSARAEFARLQFPDGFRLWLQKALPGALGKLQPSGCDHPASPQGLLALEDLAIDWPWEGDAAGLFSSMPERRARCTDSVAEGVLRPGRTTIGCFAVEAAARDMAAFVMVYGSD